MGANYVVNGHVDDSEKTSAAELGLKCEDLFKSDKDGLSFFEEIQAVFQIFEKESMIDEDTRKKALDTILQSTIADVTAKEDHHRSFQRMKAYFYIYSRVEELSKKIDINLESLDTLEQFIIDMMVSLFEETNGEEPNAEVQGEELLSKINRSRHWSSITHIDDKRMLLKFFLSIKLSMPCDEWFDEPRLSNQWLRGFQNMESIEYPLVDLIEAYCRYRKAFQHCPMDDPSFMHLIHRIYSTEEMVHPSLQTLMDLYGKMNDLSETQNVREKFLKIFQQMLRDKHYTIDDVSDFFAKIANEERWFNRYFGVFSSSLNATADEWFDLFLSLGKKDALTKIPEQNLSQTLPKALETVSLDTFVDYTSLVKECAEAVKEETKKAMFSIFEKVLIVFIEAKLRDSTENPLQTDECGFLLKAAIDISPPNHLQRPCFKKLIHQIIFPIDHHTSKNCDHLEGLFHNLASFYENFGSHIPLTTIIDDPSLGKHFLIDNYTIWCSMSRATYQQLCAIHRKTPVVISAWCKIVKKSVLSWKTHSHSTDVLIKVNDWIDSIHGSQYDGTDVLLITFLQEFSDVILTQYSKSMILIPPIDSIMNLLIGISQQEVNSKSRKSICDFIHSGRESLREVLKLRSPCSTYKALANGSCITSLVPLIDLKSIFASVDPDMYRFPETSDVIDEIIVLSKPKDINITNIQSKAAYFREFIENVNAWLQWFSEFFETFGPVIQWMRKYRVNEAFELMAALLNVPKDQNASITAQKHLVDSMLKLLEPLRDLRRLCYLLNTLRTFQILDPGTLNTKESHAQSLNILRNGQPNEKRTISARKIDRYRIDIRQHQQVQWSLISEKHNCAVTVAFSAHGAQSEPRIIYEEDNARIGKHMLHGAFETRNSGQLIITIDNQRNPHPIVIFYQIRTVDLSLCHLFDRIVQNRSEKSHWQLQGLNVEEFSDFLDDVFGFIDKLLDGGMLLHEMAEINSIISDRNLNIREELKRLLVKPSEEEVHRIPPNASASKKEQTALYRIDELMVDQVYEWFQIYEYYTCINTIGQCIEKFQILGSGDATITALKELSERQDCALKDIAGSYRLLQERFQQLDHHHLQLIKIVVEFPNVVILMRDADLYSHEGRRRFQELRDNLTTQFQLQERNSMVLDSMIMCHQLVEPFVSKAENFDEFALRFQKLTHLDVNRLSHIQVIDENLQLVKMWLAADATAVLDNALIVMEYLFKSGEAAFFLNHALNKPSFYELKYSLEQHRHPSQEDGEAQRLVGPVQPERNTFTLSMLDIDDHKRQLTFCNVDLQEKTPRKYLVEGQLQLLKILDQIFSMYKQLELAGHPNFQLRQETLQINLRLGTMIGPIKDNLEQYHSNQLKNAIEGCINSLMVVLRRLENDFHEWRNGLRLIREQYAVFKLYSNHQVMMIVFLLRIYSETNPVRHQFLKQFYLVKDPRQQEEEENDHAVRILQHYLHSLRVLDKALNIDYVKEVYKKCRIDSAADMKTSLEKAAKFVQGVLKERAISSADSKDVVRSEQYVVRMKSVSSTDQPLLPFELHLDYQTFCVLLNLFEHRLPTMYQILWCAETNEEELQLFFARIRAFPALIFVFMDVDRMHHRLREILLKEQEALTNVQSHATVYYFSDEMTAKRKGLKEFHISSAYCDPESTYRHVMALFKKQGLPALPLHIVYGQTGIGKTHRIQQLYTNNYTCSFSVNDQLHVSWLINSFLSFELKTLHHHGSVFFNVSIHAPFEVFNRVLFSLFICGSILDPSNGLVFSLPQIAPQWKFIIEVPHSKALPRNLKQSFFCILPLVAILSESTLDEVTGENHPLYIGPEEKTVAKFLKAFKEETIDRLAGRNADDEDEPVTFPDLTDENECRSLISDCISTYAPDLPKNKIFELSFTKFLYRRVLFFQGAYYCWNQNMKHLGSITMKQMIQEVKDLVRINFDHNHYPRVYLVYDRFFALRLLHSDWNQVDAKLKYLFNHQDPWKSSEHQGKDYYAECLSWLIGIRYETFMKVLTETKFVLTENFAYKLFHIHERQLTKLALIIEGETGVGKTYLLKFYSLLLNVRKEENSSSKKNLPRIIENSSEFLLDIVKTIVQPDPNLLDPFLQQIRANIENVQKNETDILSGNSMFSSRTKGSEGADATEILKNIQEALGKDQYDKHVLFEIWKTILHIANQAATDISSKLTQKMESYVTNELFSFPLIEPSQRLLELLKNSETPNPDTARDIFRQYLFHSRIKPLFYRLLIHPGITEEQLVEFMHPIMRLANDLPEAELVVFFDEVNTASCLGLFKEMFMDGTLDGMTVPKNIFFTAAINPWIDSNAETSTKIHRADYIVHQLPQSLEDLKVKYGAFESATLADYIFKKIQLFQSTSTGSNGRVFPLDTNFHNDLASAILTAQEFCERRLGKNSVSQREIQRCFNLIGFFWDLRYDDQMNQSPDALRCIALSIALIYYLRLPTEADNQQRNDHTTPTREEFSQALEHVVPNFSQMIEDELERFVNTDNFAIPQGVAINQAVREHIFGIVVSMVTRTPLCIVGVPGQSKTLSFQIVLQNLQGAQISPKAFCKRFPAIDPFFCLGSKYTTSDDVAYVFDRAIKREQQYEQNEMDARCVVFLDEASLPDERKMVLKVLHPYLDECKVAFVAIANQAFDAANANRMICIYRSLPSEADQKVLAYGCLGLNIDSRQEIRGSRLDRIISGLCQGYRRMLRAPDLPPIFHDRDFIYMLRELRFALIQPNESLTARVGDVSPFNLLRALEDNFNGISMEQFDTLVTIFASAVAEECPDFKVLLDPKRRKQRNIISILRDSMKLDPEHRRLYGRYKLIIDESEDESAAQLLFQSTILDPDPNQTAVYRLSDFLNDTKNDLRNVEVLSNIKLCMETGKTVLMINTGRIHGSLYDVFNQNFSIMAQGESRKIFSKVAIGPKTLDIPVHENFQCLVHAKRSEFQHIPAPFLSRFQKYSLSVADFYHIPLRELPMKEQQILQKIERKARSFVAHLGVKYFYGFNSNTIFSLLLSLIKKKGNNEYSLMESQAIANQLTLPSKNWIEKNPIAPDQSLLFAVLSKLVQLVPPEAILYRLPAFENEYARTLCQNYFYEQEHFSLQVFLTRLIRPLDTSNEVKTVRKLILFTRTSSFVAGLYKGREKEVFADSHEETAEPDLGNSVSLVNLTTIDDSVTLMREFDAFKSDAEKAILLIVIDARIHQQSIQIPFVRRLIDQTDNPLQQQPNIRPKYFVLLIHSLQQELNPRSCFSTTFLNDWDYWFIDTSSPGKAFHLQKMLDIFTSKIIRNPAGQKLDQSFYNLDYLFEDCLWEFCSRLRISIHREPVQAFQSSYAKEFYQQRTSITRRVYCLREMLKNANRLQQYLISLYHEKISMHGDALRKSCNAIYQICKETLCGHHLTGLIDALQTRIRASFDDFITGILKHLVDDYGLEALDKLSDRDADYHQLLALIDHSNLIQDDQSQSHSPALRGTILINDRFSFIPQTPLFYSLRQRVLLAIEKAKANCIRIEQNLDDNQPNLWEDDDFLAPATMKNGFERDHSVHDRTELFRNQLTAVINTDPLLAMLMKPSIIQSFIEDSILVHCAFVERNFNANRNPPDKTIDFLAQWLNTLDDEEYSSFTMSSNQGLWKFVNACTLLEHELVDFLPFYSACRIMDNLDCTQAFYTDLIQNGQRSRSQLRTNLFKFMFQYLWNNLLQSAQNEQQDNNQQWIENYNLISKYYPSETVLGPIGSFDTKDRIDFMNLAYLILLNEQIPRPLVLIRRLLDAMHLAEQGGAWQRFICLQELPSIIDEIYKYCQENHVSASTLMIDSQTWVLRILTSSKKSSTNQVIALFRFINQATHHLSLSIKQFLFDELSNIQLQNINLDRLQTSTTLTSFWDRISLLPTLINCLPETTLDHYHLPYHPSVITDPNQHQILLDLFFFYLRRLSNEEPIRVSLVQKILMSRLPPGTSGQKIGMGEKVFGQLKDYFLLQTTATLLCEMHTNNRDQEMVDAIVKTIIDQYLTIEFQAKQLSKNLELFLSMIITRQSWQYLRGLLDSERFQRTNPKWTADLKKLLSLSFALEENHSLRLCHQVHFTLHTDSTASVFPSLHRPYYELNQILHRCSQNKDPDHRWKALVTWIQSKLAANPRELTPSEIKVMLLLNIYYNYYCSNQLESLNGLLKLIEEHLHPSEEEQRVFRAFLRPKECIVGYTTPEGHSDQNFLNDVFCLDYNDLDGLALRHLLVNLLAMILLAGKESLLWTFAFNPSQLSGTMGFGSLRKDVVSTRVHYDCGCMLSETGAVLIGENVRRKNSELNVPGIYVVYFATFGALAWHVLLYDASIQNLYGPILSKHAIDAKFPGRNIQNKSVHARLSDFILTRITSSRLFLIQNFGSDETCILLTRCFERLACLSRQPSQNPWIRPIFKLPDELQQAEKGFQNQVFHPTQQKVTEYAEFIERLNTRSEIQTSLHDYVSQVPIIIRFVHFQRELSNPSYSHLPLTVLRHLLDSFDSLRMTQYIYHLAQFHVLLHRTFSYLIDQDEFHQISLYELYQRSRTSFARSQQFNESNKHLLIIEKGIEAVNAYHQFTGGVVRLGACDMTQRFEPITLETPVSYLVETEHTDQGDIIGRIMNVLVEFHNYVLYLLDQEFQSNNSGHMNALTKAVQELLKKDVSILQVTEEKTGVITLSQTDRQWIEKLAQASLQNSNNYFLRRDTPLSFDYLYMQSYLVRTYLLYCRINCESLRGKYRCIVRRIQPATTTTTDLQELEMQTDSSLAAEWSHLKQMSLDRLQTDLTSLQRIANIVKNSDDDELQSTYLSEFIQTKYVDSQFAKHYEHSGIKDFPLSQIDAICYLYDTAINDFQHTFVNISQEIMEPLEQQANDRLNDNIHHSFCSSLDHEKEEVLERRIQMISDFIDDLKQSTGIFAMEWSQPFQYICSVLYLDEKCYRLIPEEVKGSNYGPVCRKFIDVRSQLYEHQLNLRQKVNAFWSPLTDDLIIDPSKMNDFERFRRADAIDQQASNGPEEGLLIAIDSDPSEQTLLGPSVQQPSTTWDFLLDEQIQSTPAELKCYGQLQASLIASRSTLLFEATQKKIRQIQSYKPANRFTLHLIDKTQLKIMTQRTNFFQKWREIFQSKNYSLEQLGLVDADGIDIEFEKENASFDAAVDNEYTVIERASLVTVQITCDQIKSSYLVTDRATLSSVLARLILKSQSSIDIEKASFHVFDPERRFLHDDCCIRTLHRPDQQATIHLTLMQCDADQNGLCEVIVTSLSDQRTSQLFHPRITWSEMTRWLKLLPLNYGDNVSDYSFWCKETQTSMEDDEPLAQTLSDSSSISVDILNRDDLLTVFISFDNRQQVIRTLKSISLEQCLKTVQSRDKSHRTDSFEDCIGILKADRDYPLQPQDFQRTLAHYAPISGRSIELEVFTRISVIRHGDSLGSSEISLKLSDVHGTLKTIFDMIDEKEDYHCLASRTTKMVFDEDTLLENVETKRFYLVKDSQTCLISIKVPDEIFLGTDHSTKTQRYLIDATINDICKQNSILETEYSIQCDEDFIPSSQTPLSVLIHDRSMPLPLVAIKNQEVLTMTITCDEPKHSTVLQLLPSISFSRIKTIACRLWHLNPTYYRVTSTDNLDIDDDFFLSDALQFIDTAELKLISVATLKCIVSCGNQTIPIRAMEETLASSVIHEALMRFGIPSTELHRWKLYLMDDPESPTDVDLEFSLQNVLECLPEGTTIIPFQLRRI